MANTNNSKNTTIAGSIRVAGKMVRLGEVRHVGAAVARRALCAYHDAIMAQANSVERSLDDVDQAVEDELWAVEVAIDGFNAHLRGA